MSAPEKGPEHAYAPAVGDVVTDARTGREGRVMGHVGPLWQLRPLPGGREWDADPEHMRPNPSLAERRDAANDGGNLDDWSL
ncbi:hypothetical protein [Streptomyces lasiicapitis]|uniref:hypothetical protein n=1 Tax=Streptomyces lasiicapitis TaxID=1923961 RepID=UPI00364F25D9